MQSLVFCKAFKAVLFTLHQKTIVYQITKLAQDNKPMDKIFIEVIDQFSSTMVFSNWYLFILFYFLHSDNPWPVNLQKACRFEVFSMNLFFRPVGCPSIFLLCNWYPFKRPLIPPPHTHTHLSSFMCLLLCVWVLRPNWCLDPNDYS